MLSTPRKLSATQFNALSNVEKCNKIDNLNWIASARGKTIMAINARNNYLLTNVAHQAPAEDVLPEFSMVVQIDSL